MQIEWIAKPYTCDPPRHEAYGDDRIRQRSPSWGRHEDVAANQDSKLGCIPWPTDLLPICFCVCSIAVAGQGELA